MFRVRTTKCVVSFTKYKISRFMNARYTNCVRTFVAVWHTGTGMCHFCLFTAIRTSLILFIWKIYFILLFRRCYHQNNNNNNNCNNNKKRTIYSNSCTQRMHSVLKFTWCLLVARCRFISLFFCFVSFIVHFFVFCFLLKLTRSKHSFKWIYW